MILLVLTPVAALVGAYYGARQPVRPSVVRRLRLSKKLQDEKQEDEILTSGAIPDLSANALKEWWHGAEKDDDDDA